MTTQAIVLKPGKDKPVLHRHHWIFSGAIARSPSFTDGDMLPVENFQGEHLGFGYFSRHGSIAGRMVSFDQTPPLQAIQNNLKDAIALRTILFNQSETNAYRLVNGEGDMLPGLIVDKYNDLLVVQFTTLGMDRLRSEVVAILSDLLAPKAIYEKSVGSFRREENLPDVEGVISGSWTGDVAILESGLRFTVDPVRGQKTGFFLDHRMMRQRVRELAKGKRVLNCFSYTGGFSVYALAGGATQVDTVDLARDAIERAKRHVEMNGFSLEGNGFYAEDVFDFLRQKPLDYQLVILDPPAFAKKKKDVVAACRGYKDINRVAMEKMPSSSLLLTSSCSYHVDPALFQTVVFQAAAEAGRTARIIGRHVLAPDHPINLFHPEGDYLKSLLIFLD